MNQLTAKNLVTCALVVLTFGISAAAKAESAEICQDPYLSQAQEIIQKEIRMADFGYDIAVENQKMMTANFNGAYATSMASKTLAGASLGMLGGAWAIFLAEGAIAPATAYYIADSWVPFYAFPAVGAAVIAVKVDGQYSYYLKDSVNHSPTRETNVHDRMTVNSKDILMKTQQFVTEVIRGSSESFKIRSEEYLEQHRHDSNGLFGGLAVDYTSALLTVAKGKVDLLNFQKGVLKAMKADLQFSCDSLE